MTPTNNAILNSMFGCTVKEAREGLAERSRWFVTMEMVRQDEAERELIAECSPADFSGVTNEDR